MGAWSSKAGGSWRGVAQALVSNAKLCALVVPQQPPAQAQSASGAGGEADCDVETVQALPRRISWARLLKRVFDIDMDQCPNCGGGELKIIAVILERPVIEKILSHLGQDPQPPSPDTSSPVDCLCLARGRATGPARPARGPGDGCVRRVRPGRTEPRSGGAGLQATAQAHRTHRRHIEAVTHDSAGVALPASSVTTLAGGLRTRVCRVNPAARPGERRATCLAEPRGVLSGRVWMGETRETSDQAAMWIYPGACQLEEGV